MFYSYKIIYSNENKTNHSYVHKHIVDAYENQISILLLKKQYNVIPFV